MCNEQLVIEGVPLLQLIMSNVQLVIEREYLFSTCLLWIYLLSEDKYWYIFTIPTAKPYDLVSTIFSFIPSQLLITNY